MVDPTQVTTEAASGKTEAAPVTEAVTPEVTPTPPADTSAAPDATPKEEQAPAEQKPDAKEPEAEKPVEPIKYDLKLPDGSLLNADYLEGLAAVAQEKGLSNDEAQSLIEAEHAKVEANLEAQKSQWLTEATSDKEIGGADLQKNIEHTRRLIDKYGTDKFRVMADRYGWGNHPEVVRIFSRIAKQHADDEAVLPGSQGGSDKKPIHQTLYDHPDNLK